MSENFMKLSCKGNIKIIPTVFLILAEEGKDNFIS